MRIMPANNTSGLVHWLAGKAPDSIGLLYTPNRTEKPISYLPYVLDNGAYSAAINGRDFNWTLWWAAVDKYCNHYQVPEWLVLPDKPFDSLRTFRLWNDFYGEHTQRARTVNFALAVQDGMTPKQIEVLPRKPDVIFIGGSTDWKWKTVKDWCSAFPRVHVARVNGRKSLDICHAAGAESCDGSGWFRGREAQLLEMVSYIAEQNKLDIKECFEAVHSSRLRHSTQGVLQLRAEANEIAGAVELARGSK